jgi:hypothetical protein
MFCYVVVLLLCYFYYVVFFVSLSILIIMYVPFCVIVFFVLFVCECVLDNCHRDIGVLFDYPN